MGRYASGRLRFCKANLAGYAAAGKEGAATLRTTR